MTIDLLNRNTPAMIVLRDYQQRAVDMLYEWFEKNPTGNPALKMPGGSGKSVVIAEICRDALKAWPDTRILMVVHSKILVKQNAARLRELWPNAPVGVYSAGLGRRELGEPITYAGVQSIRGKAGQIGHIDLCLVDELHAISNEETGTYRQLMADLTAINPDMRIVGFSASPYRLGQGMVTEGKDALFTDIINPVGIEELIYSGHLAPLRSKPANHMLDTKGLHKRGGDFIASEMSGRFNTEDHNDAIVQEVIERAAGYKHWLIFCADVDHANGVAECFRRNGIECGSFHSKLGKAEQKQVLADFESGKLRALCNVDMLTTGYDFPDLDCLVFLRMTASPGLYEQMAMRAMRIKQHTDHALVLDFVGLVRTHGPITHVNPPKRKGEKGGDAPVKMCDQCCELVHISIMTCPACGAAFPAPEPEKLVLRTDDIMGTQPQELRVTSWQWRVHMSRQTGIECLKLTYYGDALSDPAISEYLTVLHDGWAGQKALATMVNIVANCGADLANIAPLEDAVKIMNNATPPSLIKYRRDGKFHRVLKREW